MHGFISVFFSTLQLINIGASKLTKRWSQCAIFSLWEQFGGGWSERRPRSILEQKTDFRRVQKRGRKGVESGIGGAIFRLKSEGFSIKKGARGGVFHFLCVSLARRYHNKVYYNLIE